VSASRGIVMMVVLMSGLKRAVRKGEE